MPKLPVPRKEKKSNKKRKSSGDAAASPAGPATEQAGPALVEKTVEVASTRPVVAKASIQPDDPTSLDADISASPNRLWTLKHDTIPEFHALMPKGQEFNFAFRDD